MRGKRTHNNQETRTTQLKRSPTHSAARNIDTSPVLIEVGDDRRVRGVVTPWDESVCPAGRLDRCVRRSGAQIGFDGELVVVSERDGRPVQDFAAVCRAVLRGDAAAAEDLRFVCFDVLAMDGEDLRGLPWTERDSRLTDALPVSGRVRRVEALPASLEAHAAIVALGFEGSVLKRPNSPYRPGRQRAWLKHKARYTVDGPLLSVRQGRDGQWYGVCDVDGRRVSVLAGAGWV